MKKEAMLALEDRKRVWKVREEEREDRQKDWSRKRDAVAEKRERWKGCCHSLEASPDNPSSLHMIISEAANEPPLHIWNTNNLTLNQKWQARLVIGRGLLLSATEHRQILIPTESLSRSLSRAMHSGQNEKHPPVNTLNPETTLPEEFASLISARCLHTFSDWTDCRVTFCFHITYTISGNVITKWYSRNHRMHCNENSHSHSQSWSFLWLRYLLFWFCVFFIMLGFSVGNKEERTTVRRSNNVVVTEKLGKIIW